MAAFNRFLPGMSKPRGVSRLRQGGFVRLSMCLARWGAKKKGFSYKDLFAGGLPGVHYETYNPDSLVQRRNLLTWSEDFTNAAWTKNETVVTPNADGVVAKINESVTNAQHYVLQVTTNGAGAPRTITVRAKAGERNWIYIQMGAFRAYFDLTAGVVGSRTTDASSIAPAADAPGYYDCTAYAAAPVNANVFFGIASADGVNTYAGTAGWGLYVARAQAENYTSIASAYQKVTDWNTEYLAAALGSVGMWQDTVGTPVTAVEQTVGLWLDLSHGLSASATDALNGIGAFNSAAGWTVTGGTGQSITGGQCVFTAMSAIGGYWTNGANPLILNAVYEVSFDIVSINAGGTVTVYAGSVNAVNRTTVGTHRVRMQCAGAGDRDVRVYGQAGTTAVVDNVTFKLVGSATSAHATQATGSSRPKLSARYNLLTKTEQFTDATWAATASTVTQAAGVFSPSGVQAWKLAEDATTSNHLVSQTVTGANTNVWAVDVKAAERSFVLLYGAGVGGAYFNLNTGASTFYSTPASAKGATNLGNGWWRIWISGNAATNVQLYTSDDGTRFTGFGVAGSGVYFARPDLRLSNDTALSIPTYQRVNTATDYDTAGFIHYLKFDGIDDSLQTSAIDFSGVNKMTVWLGTTRLSDAAVGIVVELSPGVSTSVGSFYIASPSPAATGKYEIGAKGSALNARRSADYFSPSTDAVTTQLASDAADSGTGVVMRFDGAGDAGVNQSSVASAGNFGNYSLNIGRRNNVSLPFNGRLTSLTVRGSTTPTSAAFIQSMEQYAAKLAGQTFTSA